jgi:ribonucleotide monophosphatase NagD (HAD superfamily)
MIANKLALANGQSKIEKMYFIGDNPDVDIVGANMYNHLLQQVINAKTSLTGYSLLTETSYLSAKSCESILVCTGVFDRNKHNIDEKNQWKKPTTVENDVLEGIKYVLSKEGFPFAFYC